MEAVFAVQLLAKRLQLVFLFCYLGQIGDGDDGADTVAVRVFQGRTVFQRMDVRAVFLSDQAFMLGVFIAAGERS